MTEPLGNYGIPTEPEWLIRANAGIITKTEIPRIIPPLPEGDTKDLKVWKEYWKKHDAFIAAQAREKELCELLYYINPDSRAGVVIIERLKSLRTEAHK